MRVQLSNEEKIKFSSIMFGDEYAANRSIDQLNTEEKQKLKSFYAQKIAYDTVNGHIQPPPQYANNMVAPSETTCMSTVCCCCYPQTYQNKFNLTSEIFIKRVLRTYLIWKDDFLTYEPEYLEYYGNLWMWVTYVIILGISANLNQYFTVPQNYDFKSQFILKGLGLSALFHFLSMFIYSAVIKCLGGQMQNIQSSMLTGYSLNLYFIVTILCFIPSLYWHLAMLAIGGLLRTIFLFRNYSSRVEDKKYLILILIIIIEALYCFVILNIMFKQNSGYAFNQGLNKVFKHHLQLRYYSS